ncbi:MAG: hypothetical protein JO187_02205 [Acidobacteria bacterium]|nr:hypothetical protein [Acidobacteriota bacterium]
MDKFGRYYAWFLLVTSGLAALMRLAAARRMAAMNSAKLRVEGRRTRARWMGIAVMLGSLALIPLYIWFRRQAWIPLASGVGVLSGAEFVSNAASPLEPSLVRQNRIYGALYVLATILVYVFTMR